MSRFDLNDIDAGFVRLVNIAHADGKSIDEIFGHIQSTKPDDATESDVECLRDAAYICGQPEMVDLTFESLCNKAFGRDCQDLIDEALKGHPDVSTYMGKSRVIVGLINEEDPRVEYCQTRTKRLSENIIHQDVTFHPELGKCLLRMHAEGEDFTIGLANHFCSQDTLARMCVMCDLEISTPLTTYGLARELYLCIEAREQMNNETLSYRVVREMICNQN